MGLLQTLGLKLDGAATTAPPPASGAGKVARSEGGGETIVSTIVDTARQAVFAAKRVVAATTIDG